MRGMVCFLLCLLIAGTLYLDTFRHEFSYDDFHALSRNSALLDFASLNALVDPLQYFNVSRENSYRPAVTLVYIAVGGIAGMTPPAFHAVGIIIHGLCGFLAAQVLRRFRLPDAHAAWAAALFLVHPLATETVNSPSFLEEPLTLFFMLLGLMAASGGGAANARSLIAAACSLAAMLAKETALLFPVALVTFVRISDRPRFAARRIAFGQLAALGIYFLLRFWIFPSPLYPGDSDRRMGVGDLLTVMPAVFLEYARIAIWPSGLTAVHRIDAGDYGAAWALACAAGLILLSVVAWWFPDRRMRWSWGWIVLMLIPVSQIIIPTPQIMAERFMYIPLFGICMGLATALGHVFPSPARRLVLGMMVLLAVPAIVTVQRNPVWRTNETLFMDALARDPDNHHARFALSVGLCLKHDVKAAEPHLRRAADAYPGHYPYVYNLGLMEFQLKRYAEAAELFERLAALFPDDPDCRVVLAWSYWMLNRREDAARQAEAARILPGISNSERNALEDLERIIWGNGSPVSSDVLPIEIGFR